MTRIFTDGAEMGDMLFWASYGACSASTSNARSGSYSYLIDGGTAAKKTITALSEFYLRFGFISGAYEWNYFVTFFCGTTNIASIGTALTGGIRHVTAYVNSSLVATGPKIALPSMYHLLEVHFVMGDSGTIETRLDGVDDIDYHGDTKPGADTTIDTIGFNSPGYGYGYYIDDLALNDTGGSYDNSWCGEGRILKLAPNGNGAHNNWDGSDGNKTDNYALVDEVPHNSDTDYVYTSTSSTQDQYALADFDATNKVIKRVWVEATAKKTTTDSDTLKLGILPSGGSDQLSAAQSLTMTYARYKGDEYVLNPADTSAWEDADLDALELVIEKG